MGRFFKIQDFLETGLRDMITNMTNLHALFLTYNCVSGYENGDVDTEKRGLKIVIQNGGLQYSSTAKMAVMIGAFGGPVNETTLEIGKHGVQKMVRESQTAQSAIEEKTGDLIVEAKMNGDATDVLAVVYAGLNAFDEALQYSQRLRKDIPHAKVVVLTCDCDYNHKFLKLQPLVDRDELTGVIWTDVCGGRDDMKNILEVLIALWNPA